MHSFYLYFIYVHIFFVYCVQLSKGESIDKLDDETLKTELPDFPGKETESIFQLHCDVDNYFKSLEEKDGGSVGWYFDPEFSKLKDLADYQRLVLKNNVSMSTDTTTTCQFSGCYVKIIYASKNQTFYQSAPLGMQDGVEYLNWEGYRSSFSTYNMDKEYVKFCTEMSEKLMVCTINTNLLTVPKYAGIFIFFIQIHFIVWAVAKKVYWD